MKVTRAVVISLIGSERFNGFEAADWDGFQFHRFEAVDTRDGTVPEGFSMAGFRARYGTLPRPGEMGCAMSHATVIRQFAEEAGDSQDLLLVAEDDARPIPEIAQVVRKVIRVMERRGADLVVLSEPIIGTRRSMKRYALSLISDPVGYGRRCGHPADKVAGAGLYLITRGACRCYARAVQALGGVSWLADDYGWGDTDGRLQVPLQGLDVMVVRPGLADWEGETTIQDPVGYQRFAEKKIAEHESKGSGIGRDIVALFSRHRRKALNYLAILLRVTFLDGLGRLKRRERC